MVIDFAKSVFNSAISMLNSASVWIVFSFAVAGVIHEFVGPDRMQKTTIGSTKLSGILLTTITGMCIPICSCGTIPLGISMYYSGAYLGPVLTFMTSSPMINPIALILSFGLLGKDIAIIYLITGFVAPFIIGVIANTFAGDELYYKPAYENSAKKINLTTKEKGAFERIKAGLHWSFCELAVVISKFTVSGMLIAGILFSIVPQSLIELYLGSPGLISLLGITVVAALMYVCAVGHIPFIAALVASGAAPGVAITFLMAGCATNIAELISIRKLIGKRAVIIYATSVIIISEIVGYLTNVILKDFRPVLNYDAITHSISYANKLIFEFPIWLKWTCSIVLIIYALIALYRYLKNKLFIKV